LAPAQRSDSVAAALIAETTTIGVRRWPVTRVTVPRSSESVTTSLGLVRVKVVSPPSGRRARPEYDDCAAIARRSGMALGDVMRTVEAEVDEWLKRQA